jgi:hypothetical protein
MTDLFQSINFTSHAGLPLTWKIEMDALSDPEWECIAKMIISYEHRSFFKCVGIPTGGTKLACILNNHATQNPKDPILIVDDVLTTGTSMEKTKSYEKSFRFVPNVFGWVVFARFTCPDWVTPLFQMPTS